MLVVFVCRLKLWISILTVKIYLCYFFNFGILMNFVPRQQKLAWWWKAIIFYAFYKPGIYETAHIGIHCISLCFLNFFYFFLCWLGVRGGGDPGGTLRCCDKFNCGNFKKRNFEKTRGGAFVRSFLFKVYSLNLLRRLWGMGVVKIPKIQNYEILKCWSLSISDVYPQNLHLYRS